MWFSSGCFVLILVIVMESLNFEDEISLKGVECNIPLVSIGIISVRGAPESNVHETHYGEECFTTRCQLSTGLINSVSLNTIKTKGILVIAHEEYISVGGHKHFI